LFIITGCNGAVQTVQFHARVEPSQGHVPYTAEIVCTSLAGNYIYELPDGATFESTANRIGVTVDRLDWKATVTWSDGKRAGTAAVSAHGTNAAPRISRPCINGDPYRWHLTPRERTLIDFAPHLATLSGPQTGVQYEGSWHIVSIQVECELKSLCGVPIADSIFCPPYESGKYHALWGGQVVENACIVYPLYTSETTPDGRPYAPTSEAGYTYDPSRVHDLFELMAQQNAILNDAAFPAQDATIRIVIEDEWGRQTAASFHIPVRPLVYVTNYEPWGTRTRFYFADRTSSFYHLVWSKASSPYQLITCSEGCPAGLEDCVFFCRESDVIGTSRQICPLCAGTH